MGWPWGKVARLLAAPLAEVGGMARHVISALDRTAHALAQGQPLPQDAVTLMAKPLMPAFFYRLMGNLGWHLQARKQGAFGHLRAQPFADR